ncbi:MAG: tRNA (guanine-N(7)-)-methyltransferase [Gammaproteobacteria bacterium]|nr:tRNA (guanine-N(7)-)-methyltransferase [Gammaproteobacteria bacterium]
MRREGRITRAQQRALSEYWSQYGLDPRGRYFHWDRVFGREAPLVCEIGFGNGQALLEMARDAPDCNFIGVEVYRPGVGAFLLRLKEAGIGNVRVTITDAGDFLRECVAPVSLDKLLIFFPDPWPKKRHHKRRLIQGSFVDLAASKLKPGGTVHCATDWEDYAAWMVETLNTCKMLKDASTPGRDAVRPAGRPYTKYERRGEGLGHRTWDLVFERI